MTLPPFQEGVFSDGCINGVDPALVADIAANPEDYYVNIHTDAHPNGAVRGQLESTSDLSASLSGADEVPGPGDPDGAGDATVSLVGDDLICATVHVRGTSKPTAAHIHHAADGVAGPIVVMLPTPIFNSSTGCMTIDSTLYDQIKASPSSFYVNVHTGDFPSGAVRGQLAQTTHVVGSPTGSATFVPASRSTAAQAFRHASSRGQ